MKYISILIIISFFLEINIYSQPCLSEGIIFSTQEQIDSFQSNYPNCTQIGGTVYISGENITNLNGLANITSFGLECYIYENPSLTSLSGLENLTTIGSDFNMYNNSLLNSVSGLMNLNTLGGMFNLTNNNSLTNLVGLDSLTSIEGGFIISYNQSLISLSGLESLILIGGSLDINNNPSLSNLAGLASLTTIESILMINNSPNITSLTGLESLINCGGLSIMSNEGLLNLTGLDNLTSIGNHIGIGWNNALISLTGLQNVTSIGGGLWISENDALLTLQDLIGLHSIGYDLEIKDNDQLTSLTGLDSIDASSIANLSIQDNIHLSVCEIQSVCEYIANPNGTTKIENNYPGCNTRLEVEAACEVGFDEYAKFENQFSIYPNPAYSEITIESLGLPFKIQLTLFNMNGQQLFQRTLSKPTTVIDISGLKQGVYYLKLNNNSTVQVFKIVKN